MFETPERATMGTEQKGKSSFDYVVRYRNAHRNLLKRADSLKGKDEPRRKELLKAAAKMEGRKHLSTEQVHRGALIGELDLLLDEDKHRKGKTNGKK